VDFPKRSVKHRKNSLALSGGSVNYARQQDKPFRVMVAFVAAMVVLTLAGVAVPAQAQTFTFFSFTGQPGPGFAAGFALGRDGNLYASSYYGGANNLGGIFKITPSGTITTFYSLTSADGGSCYAGLLLGSDGNFYGACTGGNSGDGFLFKLTPGGIFTTLHTFTGTDGSRPSLYLEGTDGNYYGCTYSGGINSDGTVFKMTPAGSLTTIYSFSSASWGCSGLIQGENGNFYGVTDSVSVLFKLTPAGVFTVLHTFTGSTTDGETPSGLAQGTDGNFYGAAEFGGAYGEGVIYKMTPAGIVTILHSFDVTTDLGENPSSSLVQAANGNFYGVATDCNYGGCPAPGNIFEITPSGTYTTLHAFEIVSGAYPEGAFPEGFTVDPNGTVYGVTNQGGSTGNGVFYRLTTTLKPFVSLVTTSGREGAKIGILGHGFSSASVVGFGGTEATTIVLSGTTFITATVPAGALTGEVTVATGAKTLTSNTTFRVTPTISSFTPPSRPVGTVVTINGTGLTQATKVSFNGTSVIPTLVSDIEITATVPTGATTGKIVVTTKGGSAASKTDFTVTQ
jgi:uncharacterized repeat protein (TIGR03803 family)